MDGADVLFYGDPHGEWRPLLRACAEAQPAAVIILGDCDLVMPLRQQVRPLLDAGIPVRWIPGNHDVDTADWFDRLWTDFPEGNLHGKWAALGGMTIAGLGGIFKERIWYPRVADAVPNYPDRRSYLRQVKASERWRGGLPLSARAAIFPEDAMALAKLRADILVTHEAPSSHRHGFVGIDAVATACRAKLVVHGHHHEGYDGRLPGGAWVKGLAKAEVFRVTREMLA